MFVLKQRFANDSSAENSEEDVSEGDLLQVIIRYHCTIFTIIQSIQLTNGLDKHYHFQY